ncbi:MAG: adenine deaminase [Candidatus Bipolaricaulota bacterium]|nr:adenine deaminase [Candidatus Bipolaricaulota bacterium]
MVVDLLLRRARIFDAFSGRFFVGDLAVQDGRVVGFSAEGARTVYDLEELYLVPGLIDAHVHLESSKLAPREFARAVLPHGTTAVIADPHEIANVAGLAGLRWMLEATRDLPLRVFFMAPSCVPASPLETPGAVLGPAEIREVLGWERVIGLGEVMNFPGVLAGDPEVLGKLAAARGRPIDGHAPGLSGPELWAYVRAGPRTDHESTSLPEAEAKLRAGMHILLREGTTARNLAALLPLLTPNSAPFVHFCTDDREPETLLSEGHMDDVLRKALARGVAPEVALAAATIHTARAYGLPDLGALAPGYRADFLVVSDLRAFRIEQVYVEGRLVAEGGRCVAELPPPPPPLAAPLRVDPARLSFRIPARAGWARVIRVLPHEVLTEEVRVRPRVEGGEVVADPERDILKIAVVERHRGTGNVGLGLVQGFGLRAGALASTVAHDSHHLVVVGTNDEDMRAGVAELVRLGGGQVAVRDGRVLAALPLPLGGLMSDRPLAEVHRRTRELREAARELGSPLPDPFMSLSFLALPVIPALKITDLGLVDVRAFRIVPLFVG